MWKTGEMGRDEGCAVGGEPQVCLLRIYGAFLHGGHVSHVRVFTSCEASGGLPRLEAGEHFGASDIHYRRIHKNASGRPLCSVMVVSCGTESEQQAGCVSFVTLAPSELSGARPLPKQTLHMQKGKLHSKNVSRHKRPPGAMFRNLRMPQAN